MPTSSLARHLTAYRAATAVDPLLALTSMTADGCLPCQQRAITLAVDDQPPTDAPLAGWSGVIGMEGELTGDGRLIEPNALRWEDLPLPLRYVASDVGAHDGAVVVGRINEITRSEGGQITAIGDFDLSSEAGREAARQVGEGLTTGVSMDLDDVDFEIRIAAELMQGDDLLMPLILGLEEDPESELPTDEDGRVKVAEMKSDDEVRVTTAGRIRAATIVAIPAFASAKIHLDSAPDTLAELSGGTDQLESVSDKPWSDFSPSDYSDDQWFEACVLRLNGDSRTKADNKLPIREPSGTLNRNGVHAAAARFNQVEAPPDAKAAAARRLRGAYEQLGEEPPDVIAKAAATVISLTAGGIPVDPPAAWFADPQLPGPTPMHYGEDGRVSGHMALWGTCHLSYGQQNCTPPPSSPSNYAHFHLGSLRTAEGTEIAVGHITLDTRHAYRGDSATRAMAHYDHTGMVAADVRVGEDTHGIWVAGALRPSVTPEQLRDLRSAPLSGDWRRIGYALEMIATLCVNVPGYGVPRPSGMVAGGALQSLVAAGMLAPRKVRRPGTPGALSLDDLRYLKRLADRERAEEATLVAAGRLDVATDLARRVRASTLALRVRRSHERAGV